MPSSKFMFPLYLAAGCATAAAALPSGPILPAAPTPRAVPDDAATLRDRGPAGLAVALAEFDAAPADQRAALADKVDRVAAQKYAATSRLYWYTDLAKAEAEAQKAHRPILALRMLGQLGVDRSCANSRLFRTTLYANKDVSAYLRNNFVLYWSSERDVPQVTITYGDGRTIQTTITGNSAHYVLAPDGAVLDVLPGMYAPGPFRAELAKSLALAKKVAALAPEKRADEVRAYHGVAVQETAKRVAALGSVGFLPGSSLTGAADAEDVAMRAQRATVSKAYVEVPVMRSITASEIGELPESDTAAWGAIGLRWWASTVTYAQRDPSRPRTVRSERFNSATPPRILDDASIALVKLLHAAGPVQSDERATEDMLRRLEQHVMADSALDELRLRPQIHQLMAEHTLPFEQLNAFVYAAVFHTPAEDAWLGLLPRTDFTGLPGDGVSGPPSAFPAPTATARR